MFRINWPRSIVTILLFVPKNTLTYLLTYLLCIGRIVGRSSDLRSRGYGFNLCAVSVPLTIVGKFWVANHLDHTHFPGLSRSWKFLEKKSRTFQEAWEPCFFLGIFKLSNFTKWLATQNLPTSAMGSINIAVVLENFVGTWEWLPWTQLLIFVFLSALSRWVAMFSPV